MSIHPTAVRSLLLILVLLVAPFGCTKAPSIVVIPHAQQVQRIAIVHPEPEKTIDDLRTIAAVISILNDANHGWRIPLTTYPTPRWIVELTLRGDDQAQRFWLGENWLGEGGQTTDLTDAQWSSLKRLLGLN